MTINDALALHQAGRLDEAERVYLDVLAAQPDQYHALHFLGVLRAQKGDLQGSVDLISRSLALFGANALAEFHLAESLRRLQCVPQAAEHYRQCLARDASFVPAYAVLGGCLIALDKAGDALAVCDEGLKRAPQEPSLHTGRGEALAALGRSDEALAAFEAAIARDPAQSGAIIGQARILFQSGHRDGAFAALSACDPNAAEPLIAKAIFLAEIGVTEAALQTYQAALAIEPSSDYAYYAMGCLLLDLRLFPAAVAAFDSALTLRPNHYPAEYNRAWALERMGRRDDALAGYERALAINPESGTAACKAFYLRALSCDWRQRGADLARLHRLAGSGARLDAFSLLSAIDDPALHLAAARLQAAPARPRAPARPLNSKRHIAYLSPDFYDHPVAHHLVGVLEAHDRARFEITALCVEFGQDCAIRSRIRHAVDHFVEAASWSDSQIASYLEDNGIDIAVDLAGFTMGGRTAALAAHPVAITAGWLGYAGTTGTTFIDYIIADPVLIPPADERYYTECVVRLPYSYLPRDGAPRPGSCPSRSGLGLPDDAFVFCGFNNTYKLTPEIFDVWMRLLHAVENSVLWLNVQDETARANLRHEADARGLAAQRLIFAPRTEARADHLARLAAADLFLDTLPYGAHATASDMVWAGVPVLTVTGKAFASRVAAGLLTALNLPELIAPDLAAYEAMALELARNRGKLAALRAKIAESLPTAAAFDPAQFAAGLESAYESMAERVRRGAPPAPFSVTLAAG